MSLPYADMVHSDLSHDGMLSKNNPSFFEGVEKLLEVWFSRKDGNTSNCDLRKIPRSQLEMIMRVVKCEIISFSSSDDLDAYVLRCAEPAVSGEAGAEASKKVLAPVSGESSMFVSSKRFILKTCGTTTPLLALPLLLSLAHDYAGYDSVQDLYYSRKNFKRPELQITPHRNFDEEASLLKKFFPGRGGRAYCLGSLNGEDCWYLYTVSPLRSHRKALVDRQNLPIQRVSKAGCDADQTLEVLMTDLDPKKMMYFNKSCCQTAGEATQRSGIDKLIPGVIIDSFQFDPCGYSMNGLSRNVPGGYMTIHVTPESEFSYVSLETNIPQKSYKDFIQRVINTFGPKQFVITFFSSEATNANIGLDEDSSGVPEYADYDVEDIQICRLPGYDLTYALYNRFPS